MLLSHRRMLLLSVLVLGILAVPVASVHARIKDPFVTATHTGGTGGGDGDVIFEIINTDDTHGVVNLQVTETDTGQNDIKAIANTPAGWSNTGIVPNSQGKGVQTTWLTCAPGLGCAPVTINTSLGGFDARMNGQTPYGFHWVLTDSVGTQYNGNLSAS